MRKIQFAIVGFVTGIMLGLLLGLAEMRIFKQLQNSMMLPFVVGITILAAAIAGVVIGVKKSKI
ncbi:MAG: hypothetical protein ABIN67_20495 [Ferruginibacter sp.]